MTVPGQPDERTIYDVQDEMGYSREAPELPDEGLDRDFDDGHPGLPSARKIREREVMEEEDDTALEEPIEGGDT
jgi:hypothetical protein